MKQWKGSAVAAAVVALVTPPTAASADGGHHGDHGDGGADNAVVSIATEPLQGPRQLNDYRGNQLVVAESDSGEVSAVDRDSGAVDKLLTFGSPGAPSSPQGIDYADGRLFVALGELGGGPEAGPPAPVQLPPDGTPVPSCTETSTAPAATALIVAEPHGGVVAVCDLLQYELVVNPDGQTQVDQANVPVDSLSNPFSVLAQNRRVLVADAGANSVLAIDRSGEISTFFVPPLVTDGACAGAPNNPASAEYPATVGCDPVPTGVTEGPDGLIYVSTLGALTPGAGRVYVLTPDGEEVRRIEGLNPLTGIAVDREGAVYASELTGDVPIDSVAPGSPVGRVVRIDRDGDLSYAAVTLPQGLEFEDGGLYASAFSLVPAGGQVVRVGPGAFTEAGAP
jgi:hypothetical protein